MLRVGSKSRSGFTLIELVIVIAIILILLVILIFFILAAVSKGKAGTTQDLLSQIESCFPGWRQGEGKAGDAFPTSGTNTNQFPKDKETLEEMIREGRNVTAVYAGNRALYRELVTIPKSKGRKPYLDLPIDLVGYLDRMGRVMPAGDEEDAVILDGWGKPLIYWEWASLTRSAQQGATEEIPGRSSASSTVVVPKWAQNRGSYDIYSAGPDLVFANVDDLSNVNTSADGPAETPVSGVDPVGAIPVGSRK